MEQMGQDRLSREVVEGPRRLWAICRAAERYEIARVLEECSQNRTHAAAQLGISRRTLLNKIKQYGLTRSACRLFREQPIAPFEQRVA